MTLAIEQGKAAKRLVYLLEIEVGHRIDADSWTVCAAPNTSVFWMDHLAEGEPTRVKECARATHSLEEYAEKASIAECQGTAKTWYYDSTTGRLYVHTSGGNDPSTAGTYYLCAYFWERLCDGQREGSEAVYYNDAWYLPYLDETSIPDVTLEVSTHSEGGIKQSFGTVGLLNADGYFDTRVADYVYTGKQAVLKVGAPGDAYGDFTTIWRGRTGGLTWSDETLEVDTEDDRKAAD